MLITAIAAGSRGDVQPFVNLGREMRRRGHRFRVCCLPRFQGYVEESGLEFAPLEFDGGMMMRALLSECKDGMAYLNGMKALWRDAPRPMEQVCEAIRGSDAVLYILLGGFVHHACEAAGIPCARCMFYPFDRTDTCSMMMPELKPGSPLNGLTYAISELGMNMVTKDLLNGWRKEHGLKPWGLFSGDYLSMNGKKKLTLYPFSEKLVPRDPKWGGHIHITGFWDSAEAAEYTPDDRLRAFLEGGEKPFYAGFGSIVFSGMDEVQRRVLEALRMTGARAVLSSGWMKWTERNDPNLCFVDYVPHGWLFRQVRGVIHHGGAGTTYAGLRAGAPTQVVSFGGDQLFWGKTVQRLGLGPAPIDQEHGKWTAEDLARGIEAIRSGRYGAACAAMSRSLAEENGCANAADILEETFA